MYIAMTVGPLELVVGLVVLVLVCLALRRAGPYGWLGLSALLVTCALTNPDKGKHATAVKDKLVAAERSAMGRIAVDMVGGMIEPLLEHHNFVVLSTTTVNGRLVSFGFLSQVLVVAEPGDRTGKR